MRRHIHGPDREMEGEAGAGEKEELKSIERGPIDAASSSCHYGARAGVPDGGQAIRTRTKPRDEQMFPPARSRALSAVRLAERNVLLLPKLASV
ncbi:hypothetical protein SKAU_G00397350 [Synaphobranchus kaupii]|uniref:Uncharacterized protein n=1 Tax=Synaphobranchus kaupii TaxID=118154 RepID=A0A9Q1IC16_SYNKA|nr:hypothetical protein SKAU_G00397350 [Synaphobranchus kaupii]